jgi:hypothetical protein
LAPSILISARRRQLNQDAIHSVVVVEFIDQAKQFVRGNRGGRRVHPAGQPDLLASGNFGFDVKLRGRIFAH